MHWENHVPHWEVFDCMAGSVFLHAVQLCGENLTRIFSPEIPYGIPPSAVCSVHASDNRRLPVA